MRKADTRKVKFVKDNTLIVAIDVGMDMNHGRYNRPGTFCQVSYY